MMPNVVHATQTTAPRGCRSGRSAATSSRTWPGSAPSAALSYRQLSDRLERWAGRSRRWACRGSRRATGGSTPTTSSPWRWRWTSTRLPLLLPRDTAPDDGMRADRRAASRVVPGSGRTATARSGAIRRAGASSTFDAPGCGLRRLSGCRVEHRCLSMQRTPSRRPPSDGRRARTTCARSLQQPVVAAIVTSALRRPGRPPQRRQAAVDVHRR